VPDFRILKVSMLSPISCLLIPIGFFNSVFDSSMIPTKDSFISGENFKVRISKFYNYAKINQ